MTVEAGRKLGRYVLARRIGAGGMAEVWEAFDAGLHRHVAVKVVRDEIAGEAEFRERFIREARLAAQLEHPRILPIWDFGTESGVTYLVMPLLPGGSLKERITGPLPADEAVEALAAVAAALDHAHSRGVLHRDVKPSNVLVDGSGSYLLADFGLAKNTAVSSELTATGMVIGTPAYMAPEQAIGRQVDPRADQYALAVMAFELLTGRTPFRSESPFAVLDKHLRAAPPPPSSFVLGLPAEVDAVLARALAKRPEERFESCRELVEAIAAALGAAMPARASTAARVPPPFDQRRASAAGTPPPLDPTRASGPAGPPPHATPTGRTPPPLGYPSNATLPAPQTAVTMRRPAPAGPSTGTIVAAVVVVALLFVVAAAGVGWMLFGRKGEPAPPPVETAVLPDPTPTEVPASPEPEAPEEEPAAEEEDPTHGETRVTIEELAVPTAPAPRPTPMPARTPAPAHVAVAPTPEPVAVPATPEPARAAEPAKPASRLERVVPFRTGERIDLGIVERAVTVRSIEVSSWPKPEDVAKAESKPSDTTRVTVKLAYENSDRDEWKCQFRVHFLDAAGKEIGFGERETSLSSRERDDTKRVWVRMRTVDFPKVAKIRVRIAAWPD